MMNLCKKRIEALFFSRYELFWVTSPLIAILSKHLTPLRGKGIIVGCNAFLASLKVLFLNERTVIVFSPHPDDETLGCGGTIAKKVAEGYAVYVVVLTDGRNAFSKVLNVTSNPTPGELKAIRREEVIQALTLLGVPKSNAFFLDFEDGSLSAHEQEVEIAVTSFLKSHLPDEVYFPIKREAHPDHQAANKIVHQCLLRNNLREIGFQYSVVHKYSRIGPALERAIGFFARRIKTVDVSDYLAVKKEALDKFKSETGLYLLNQKKPIVSVKGHLEPKEVFFR